MALPVVVVELEAQLALARELAAGRVFVSGCQLPITTACEVIVRGVSGQAMSIAARVVFVDAPRGVGLELVDFHMPKRLRLAELVAGLTAGDRPANAPDTPHIRARPANAPDAAEPRGPGEPSDVCEVVDAPTLRRPLAAHDLDDELVLVVPTVAPPPPLLDRANRTPSVAPPLRSLQELPELPPDLAPGELDLFDAPTTHRKVGRGFVRIAPSPIDRMPSGVSDPLAGQPAAAACPPIDGPRDAGAVPLRSPKHELLHKPHPARSARVDLGIDTFQLETSEVRPQPSPAATSPALRDDGIDGSDGIGELDELGELAADPGADRADHETDADADADADADDAAEGGEERRAVAKNVHERLRGLSMAEQVKTAHSPDPQERIALERLYGKNVWEPLLRNPRLTAPEVVRLARMGTMPRVLVEVMVSNGTWLGIPEVRRALLANPRLGADQIPRVLRAMPKHELKLAATQLAYPAAVREAAKRLVRGG